MKKLGLSSFGQLFVAVLVIIVVGVLTALLLTGCGGNFVVPKEDPEALPVPDARGVKSYEIAGHHIVEWHAHNGALLCVMNKSVVALSCVPNPTQVQPAAWTWEPSRVVIHGHISNDGLAESGVRRAIGLQDPMTDATGLNTSWIDTCLAEPCK